MLLIFSGNVRTSENSASARISLFWQVVKVKAFRVPAGVLVEVYATTLHYAPCHTDPAKGFRVLVALPQGTNTEKPAALPAGGDAALLWARNKWLLAHKESAEAAQGAYIGLTGENIDLSNIG